MMSGELLGSMRSSVLTPGNMTCQPRSFSSAWIDSSPVERSSRAPVRSHSRNHA